jgi:hypothetical protein
MGFEQYRSEPLPEGEVQETASELIQEFKDAAHEELPGGFERNGTVWTIDAADTNDRNRLVVTAKTQNNLDKVILETSTKTIGSIQYEASLTTSYGSATASPGENTKKALENTRGLLERLKSSK